MLISVYAYTDDGGRIADVIEVDDSLTSDERDKKAIEAIMEHIEWGWYVLPPEKENEEDN